MKKCPKCGASNRDDSAACSSCYAALEGVPVTASESAAPPTAPQAPSPVQYQPETPPAAVPGGSLAEEVQPEGPVSVVGQPLGASQPSGGYAPQQNPYGPPPGPIASGPRRGEVARPKPTSKPGGGGTAIAIILVLILLGGGGFAYWKFVYLPNTPLEVARTLVKAWIAGDKTGDKYMTKNSVGGVTGFDPTGGIVGKVPTLGLTEQDYVLELASSEAATSKVNFKLQPAALDRIIASQSSQMPIPAAMMEPIKVALKDAFKEGMPIVLAKEEGKWKVDGPQTNAAIMGVMFGMAAKFGAGLGGPGMKGGSGMPGSGGMSGPVPQRAPGGR